jgi:putative tryptophan/tyrosine transport system substrate-binding protein
MKRAAVPSILVAVVLLAVAVIAEAQQPKKVPRIGFLTASSASSQASRLDAFRQSLRELGYVEGKNIVIEYRYAEGLDRLPALAAELARLKVDVIVTGGTGASRAAKEATLCHSNCHGAGRRSCWERVCC